MEELSPGLFETLVTEGLKAQLEELGSGLVAQHRALHPTEAADRVALHLGKLIEQTLSQVSEQTRLDVALKVGQEVLKHLETLGDLGDQPQLISPATVLQAVVSRHPDGSPADLVEPLIPLLDTTLLTNAPGEPNLWTQLRSEIDSADRIDVVMAFIRRSGINPLIEELRRHCDRGRPLRVLTTTYTASTEQAALDQLASIGADIRVSYDVSTTRLHAKAWLFHRQSGLTTGYIGSSNLTHSAQATGLEWNVRTSEARNPDIVTKFIAVFDSYWENGDFLPYQPNQFAQALELQGHSATGPQVLLSPIELRPLPFQERLLELVEVSRARGYHRNLLVAATGTGKTVMAAIDFARLKERLPRSRLLFIAHRKEILDQSQATFRYALRDPSFGEQWVGGRRPTKFEHVFASIQSLQAADVESLPPEHFDVVIVDEFHHAAAPSYRKVLDRLAPIELLGLTATPERSDGLPLLNWFDDRIAAELRLWDAIDQQYLAPFHYYGIHDGLDLTEVPWRRGHGYEIEALANVYTSSDAWARLVVHQVQRHCDPMSMRALGFCVSVSHARFMAEHFNRHGIASMAVSGASPPAEREGALQALAAGDIKVLFSVDLFNEGVDVPDVDTILMLRPTESPVLFMQQLGRGLRRSPDKAQCTVLDFVGTHRKEFRFDRRFRALLGGTRREVEHAVRSGFPYMPTGCNLQLDQKATEVVLRSLRNAIPSTWRAIVEELRSLRANQPDVTLADYLTESGLELDDVYAGNRSWSDLCDAVGISTLPPGPDEATLRRAVGRLLHVDDEERITGYLEFLGGSKPNVQALAERQQRLVQMLAASMADRSLTSSDSLQAAVDLLWAHPQVMSELRELMSLLSRNIDHLHQPLIAHPSVPLQVHARYSRIEILAAMGVAPDNAKLGPWQSGVLEAKAANAELLTITLDKSTGGFSPKTRYRDYAISRTLMHWESQAATRQDSATGLRYRHHKRDGRSILLFARLRVDDRAFWFLGPATYCGHIGERPMAITWELDVALPGDLYAEFAAAVA